MKMSPRVREIIDNYEGETPGTKAKSRPHADGGPFGRYWTHGYPAGRSGFRAWAGAQLCRQSAAYDPHYHYQFGDRSRFERLCRTTRLAGGRRRYISPEKSRPFSS